MFVIIVDCTEKLHTHNYGKYSRSKLNSRLGNTFTVYLCILFLMLKPLIVI